EIFVPSGEFPAPNHELVAARSYRAGSAAPESFIAWPVAVEGWGDDTAAGSNWAEEAFAKACAQPNVFVPPHAVSLAWRECGSSNFAQFMQSYGFRIDGRAYLDGPFYSVNWTNATDLNGAIANVGPVKIGINWPNL